MINISRYLLRQPPLFRLPIFVVSLLLLVPTLDARAAAPDLPPKIIIDTVAISVWDDDSGNVGVQMLLKNIGRSSAMDLKVTEMKVVHGNYVGPAMLPASLGDVDPDKDAMFDSIIKVPVDGKKSQLILKGTYKRNNGRGEKLQNFAATTMIEPSATPPSPISSIPGIVMVQDPNNVDYPPAPPPVDERPNAEEPIMIPIGPPRLLPPPINPNSSMGSEVSTVPGAAIQIPVNTTMRSAGVPPDPSAAAASPDGVVLATYNTGISYSVDGGNTFTDVNLFSPPDPSNPARTTFFPQSDNGLCCDQVVVYLINQNLFVWLLQYNPIITCASGCGGPNPTNVITQPDRLRIAWATPAAIIADFSNAWVYGDLTGTNVPNVSSGLGINANEWLDYPDLAWSDTYLYVGIDHGFTVPGKVYGGRRIVARLSLANMADPTATVVNYSYAELTGSNGLNKTHFVQGASDRMLVGSLDNSSTLRVFTWKDSDSSIPSATLGITSIQQGSNYTSVAPDGTDWLAVSFPGNITGATYHEIPGEPPTQQYLFAFDAGVNGGGRPRSYVRIETLSPSGDSYMVASEYDIWNPDYAYAMAALGSDGIDIGISLAVGGGTIGYPQMAVGFKNDFVVYQVTNSDATQTFPLSGGGSGSRFGDYLSARPIAMLAADGSSLFSSEVYDVTLPSGSPGGSTCLTVGCTANMRFVQFGRPAIPGPF